MRFCPRHIPHNLIAGGGLDGYGGQWTGHPDIGGNPPSHHGEIAEAPSVPCSECAALTATSDRDLTARSEQHRGKSRFCERHGWHHGPCECEAA